MAAVLPGLAFIFQSGLGVVHMSPRTVSSQSRSRHSWVLILVKERAKHGREGLTKAATSLLAEYTGNIVSPGLVRHCPRYPICHVQTENLPNPNRRRNIRTIM